MISLEWVVGLRAPELPLHRGRHRLFALLAFALSSCASEPESHALSGREQEIIYNNDDRLDVFAHPNAQLRELARTSVVALVPRSRIGRSPEGDSFIVAQPLETTFNVCSDQRFAAQRSAAECTGVLIDDDLVLTAGHCFPTDDLCSRYAFLFDYFLRAEAEAEPLSWGDVYGCRRIVKRILSPGPEATPRIDFAVLQLDRPALGRSAVPLRTSALHAGEPLATIGCASGLPLKIDSNAHVLDTRPDTLDYFLLDSDTFQGSSGSGVFDVNGQLVGVLVRGGLDYKLETDASCQVPNVISWSLDAGPPRSSGEEATYAARILAGVCAEAQWPSGRLCNAPARCGDGICNDRETKLNCPVDCGCQGAECPSGTQRPNRGDVIEKASSGCALARGSDPAAWSAWWIAAGAWLRRRVRRRARINLRVG